MHFEQKIGKMTLFLEYRLFSTEQVVQPFDVYMPSVKVISVLPLVPSNMQG